MSKASGARSGPEVVAVPRSGVVLDDQGWYPPSRIAEVFGVSKEALRKRLDKYRERNERGWKENEGRRPREAKYLYLLGEVRHIAEALRISSQRPAR